MTTHRIHKGDTGTPLQFYVGDKSGPWDLTDAQVTFRYIVDGEAFDKDVTPDADQENNAGLASAFWGATELDDVAPENYPCYVIVTFENGRIRKTPYGVLRVMEAL